MHSDLVVDQKTRGLRNVVVLLENGPAQPKLHDAEAVVIDQKDWIFQPRVSVVQWGRPIRFTNSDQVNHSVMAESTVAGNTFNSIAGPGQPIDHVFQPERVPIRIGCSLHPWMRAWIYVLRHPWFAITGEDGSFRIGKVPPGRYTLLFVHPDTGRREKRTVDVKSGQDVKVSIEWRKAE